MKIDNKKTKLKRQSTSNFIIKNTRAKILVKILYIEAKLKTLLFTIFSSKIYSQIKIYAKSSIGYTDFKKIFKLKNEKLEIQAKKFLESFKYTDARLSKMSNGKFCDILTFGQVSMVLKFINLPALIFRDLKIPNIRTSKQVKLINNIRWMRNTLSHPPRDPKISLSELLYKCRIKAKNTHFPSIKNIHDTLNKMDKFFEKVNAEYKK